MTALLRALGPWTATAIVVGTVIGSGIFVKPAAIAGAVPDFPWVGIVWIVGGLLSLLGALALAEVAVLLPQAGGNYVYLREAFGRLMGFLWGWVEFWIIRAASIAALATIFSQSLHDILRLVMLPASGNEGMQGDVLSFWQERWLTVGVLAVLTLVNIRGVRWGGGLQFFITLVKVASLLSILVLPFALWAEFPRPEVLANPNVSFTWSGVGTALLGVLWAYHGWMNVAPVAGEVHEPQKNLPRAFVFGTGTIVLLYLGCNLAYHLTIPQDEMAALRGTTVVAEFGRRLVGPAGGFLAAGAVMISVFGALNGNLLVGPRLLYAMARDRLAPRFLAEVHVEFRTPHWATLLLAGWSILLVLGAAAMTRYDLPVLHLGPWTIDVNLPTGKRLFDLLTDYAMFGAVIFETLAVATIFVFRRTRPDAERPYRCPLYPWVPLLYLVVPAFVLWNMLQTQRTESTIGLGFIAVGALVYYLAAPRTSEEAP